MSRFSSISIIPILILCVLCTEALAARGPRGPAGFRGPDGFRGPEGVKWRNSGDRIHDQPKEPSTVASNSGARVVTLVGYMIVDCFVAFFEIVLTWLMNSFFIALAFFLCFLYVDSQRRRYRHLE
jgi:hypothetical protein